MWTVAFILQTEIRYNEILEEKAIGKYAKNLGLIAHVLKTKHARIGARIAERNYERIERTFDTGATWLGQ